MDDLHDVDTAGNTPEARFGGELRRVRVQANVTLRRLAKDLGRAHSTISDFENGRRLAPVEVVEQYEDYFGLARGALGAQRERARASRLELPRDATLDENLGEVVCPYKGLHAFEFDDAELFFGREDQIKRVLAQLTAVRFVAVVGASGSGKSSFVRAGLLPGIGAAASGDATTCIAVLTPGAHPVDALARAVAAATGGSACALADDLHGDPDALERAACQAGGAGLVVAVDQFEELFTQCRDEAERRCFIDALIAAWRDPASPIVVILALRADFYGRVAAYPELAAAVVAHQTLLGPMLAADLRRAIELPAAQAGLLLQRGLAQTMVEDLADEPGALPLLSHALLETWKRRVRLMLTVGGYREAGGVRGALAHTAEHTLQNLADRDQVSARSIFLNLTDIGDGSAPTRRRVDRVELAAHSQSADALDRVLGILADARLVTIDERTVVVSHEALIRHWPRLRGWIEADRAGLLIHRRLTDAAREWDTLDREQAALFRGARLATASEWAAGHPHHLSQLDSDFLTASQAAERRELEAAKHRTRRLRALSTGLAALTVIVTALAAWALDQRSTARREATVATALVLASAAPLLLKSRPDVSLILALEAYRTSPRPEARSSVLAALTAVRDPGILAILHGHTDAVYSVALSPDGRTLASASADTTIRLWDIRTHKQLGTPLRGHIGRVRSLAFSRDGRTLASASADTTIRLWNTRSHQQLGHLTGHTGAVSSVAFSPDGQTVASASADTTIRLWNTRSHRQLGQALTGHRGAVSSVAFSPDRQTLASASQDKTIRLWNTRSHRQLGHLTGHTGAVSSVAFSRDGQTLASASADTTIRLWTQHLGQPLRSGHKGPVSSVAFSPDGQTVASASADTTIRLWNTRSHRQLGHLTGHTGAVSSVAFSHDGQTLASASSDSTIRLWDIRAHTPLAAPLIDIDVVYSVAFSRDGRTLVSAGADHTIRLWGIRSHRQIQPLRGHTGAVTSVTVSPDGRTLASGGRDKTVRLWDLGTHKPLGIPLTGHTDVVRSLAFSPGGGTLASGGNDKMVRLWENILWRNVQELQTEVCNLVGNGLSETEWAQYAAGISYRESCP